MARPKVDVLEVVRLKRELFRGITVADRRRPRVGSVIAAGRDIRQRRGAGRARDRVEDHADIDWLPGGKRESEVVIFPGCVALVVVQGLIVAEAGARQHLEVESDAIRVQRGLPVLKKYRIVRTVIRRSDGPSLTLRE